LALLQKLQLMGPKSLFVIDFQTLIFQLKLWLAPIKHFF